MGLGLARFDGGRNALSGCCSFRSIDLELDKFLGLGILLGQLVLCITGGIESRSEPLSVDIARDVHVYFLFGSQFRTD